MKSIIIAFKSRNTLQRFVHFAKLHNVACKIVNTPHAISTSCGLSAKTDYMNYGIVISLLSQVQFSDLIGVYLFSQSNSGSNAQRLM